MSREISGDERLLVSLALRHGEVWLGRANKGLFDREIVCSDCEKLFKKADDCAIRFRRAALKLEGPVRFEHGKSCFPTFQADSNLLHKFATNTLLRAQLSSRHESRQINDDEFESEAKDQLLSGSETIHLGRQVALVVTTGALASTMASPVLHPLPDYPVYRLQMPHFEVFIAASKAGLMPGFRQIALSAGDAVTVWRRRRPMDFELDEIRYRFDATGDRTDRMLKRSA